MGQKEMKLDHMKYEDWNDLIINITSYFKEKKAAEPEILAFVSTLLVSTLVGSSYRNEALKGFFKAMEKMILEARKEMEEEKK